jgi:hypothetical protein
VFLHGSAMAAICFNVLPKHPALFPSRDLAGHKLGAVQIF